MNVRHLGRLVSAFAFLVSIGTLLPFVSFADTATLPNGGPWYVSPTGNDTNNDGLSQETPFATLEKAIQAADENGSGTIYLAPGTYTPSGYATFADTTGTNEKNGYVLTNAIAIVGQGSSPNETIITTNSASKVRPFYLDHADARIENLTVTGGVASASIGGNVFIGTAGGTVSNCRILNGNSSAWNAGGGNIAMYGGRVTRSIVRGYRCPSSIAA